jgi:hypothetical protein
MMPRRDWKQAGHWIVAKRFNWGTAKWFKAPKGRTVKAQGNALGTKSIRNPALKGRNIALRIKRDRVKTCRPFRAWKCVYP